MWKSPALRRLHLSVFLFVPVSGKRKRRRSERTCGGNWKSWSWGEEFRTVMASFPPKQGSSSILTSSSNQCSATGTPQLHAPCAIYFTVHSCICTSVFPHQPCKSPVHSVSLDNGKHKKRKTRCSYFGGGGTFIYTLCHLK